MRHLVEDMINPGFDYNSCIPQYEDFEKVIYAYNDYKDHGARCDFTSNPKRMGTVMKDQYKLIRRLIVAIMIRWEDLKKSLFNKCLEIGYTEAEIKTIINYLVEPAQVEKYQKNYDTYCKPFFGESLEEDLHEDVEKHDELNPKLFENNKLKPEVKEKIIGIVNEFVAWLHLDKIAINVTDVVMIGSNASYNYTKDSDLDLHIMADTKTLDCPPEVCQVLYGAYRSIFNDKLGIEFYGIPVEIFVETESLNPVSNGIYSVMKDEWIKEPVKDSIPEIDREALDKSIKEWEDRYNKIVAKIDSKLTEALGKKVAVDFECPECGNLWSENYDEDYFEDEQDLQDTFDNCENECRRCGCEECKPVSYGIDEALTEEISRDSTVEEKAAWAAEQFKALFSKALNNDPIDKTFKKLKAEAYKKLRDICHSTGAEAADIMSKALIIYHRSLHESVNLHEDVESAKSIIADQIRGEWEAIQNYNKAEEDLAKLGNFDEVIDILNSISNEEEVHVGELEYAQSLLDSNIIDNIEDGRDEAEEDLAGKEAPVDESLTEETEIDEALDYAVQEKKMDQWHSGSRGANVASMSPEKLEMNAVICDRKGYTLQLKILEAEARKRGIKLSTMLSKGPASKELPKAYPMDITVERVNEVKKYKDVPSELISRAKIAGHDENMALYLIIALIYKATETAKVLKTSLNVAGYNDTAIKKFIDDCAAYPDLLDRITGIMNGTITESLTEEIHTEQIDEVQAFIDDLYALRRAGLPKTGEYGVENLTFKEIRNKGYLDHLKDLRNKLAGVELSLKENLVERLDYRLMRHYREELSRIAHNQAIVQENGLFNIYNVKEDDLTGIMNRIRNLDYVEWVNNSAGAFDFSQPQFMGPQKRRYNIVGKIKDNEELI